MQLTRTPCGKSVHPNNNSRLTHPARLGRRVMDLHRPRPKSGNGREQHDPAKTPLDHLVLDREHDAKRAVQIGVDRLEPAFVRELRVVRGVANRPAMTQQIDGAEFLACGSDQRVDLILPAHVARPGERFSSQRANLGHHRVGRILPATVSIATSAPPRASCKAVARPMPRDAPVTNATRPSNSPAIVGWSSLDY